MKCWTGITLRHPKPRRRIHGQQEHRIQRWQPAIWIHGHVHDRMNYRIGKTRVLCNPWGYPNEGNTREYRIVETNTMSKEDSYA
ncbi:hypothetical protein [Acidithiobacillus sulfurivorans]|uniref:hypothetical protein n=1 Tax=Acidithiobacillus sulfurivorans TaxID=1958756 RepID=UPI001C066875|nr:hypothetical protein [Acidithiobacillus sulfurivorans]